MAKIVEAIYEKFRIIIRGIVGMKVFFDPNFFLHHLARTSEKSNRAS